MISTIFILLFLFQIKHFLCDYIFQGSYMLGKFNKVNWEVPLAMHCLVHFIGTFIIASFFSFNYAIVLSCLDFIIHFIVDKGKVELSRSTNHSEAKFWHLLGLDQMIHHLTNYLIIAVLINI